VILCILAWSGLLLAFFVVLIVGLVVGSMVTVVGIDAQRKFEEEGK
jgi:hypothetical protein